MSLEDALQDTDRVEYYQGATQSILAAIHEDGVDIRSYFAWSFLDNFEWCVRITRTETRTRLTR